MRKIYSVKCKINCVANKIPGIYPISFTNVHFQTKIEFLNIVKCRWGSQGAVNCTTGLRQNLGRGPWGSTSEKFGLFTSEGQLNSFKQKKVSNMTYFECKFNANTL